jgi:hypothetical protein
MAKCRESICLYGDTGSGKTYQEGELAEYTYRTERKRTRLYGADPGGWATLQPLINAGIIEAVDCTDFFDKPWELVNNITRGAVVKGGKLVVDPAANEDIQVFCYEGITSLGNTLMLDMQDKSARGVNIGGGGAFSFQDGDFKVGSNNQSHYQQAQSRLYHAVIQSQRLAGKTIVWTAAARRGEDPDNKGVIIAPQAPGKAINAEIPQWFVYTFHLIDLPLDMVTKTKAEYRLYLQDAKDPINPGAKILANCRLPPGAPPFDIPFITPASVVKALELIKGKSREAEEALRARIAPLAGAVGV